MEFLSRLAGTLADSFKVLGRMVLKQITTPSNPASGYNALYFKSDSKAYRLTSAGDEQSVLMSGDATAMPTASKIPIADGSGKLDGWVTGGNVVDPTIVGGRLELVSAEQLKWDFVTGNAIALYNTSWELVRCASSPTLEHDAAAFDGNAMLAPKIYDIFAEYSSSTTFTLIGSPWVSATAGSSARNAAYAAGTTYSIGDRVTSGGHDYMCIQGGSGHTPSSSPTYWQDNGTSITGDFAGLYQHEGVWVSDSSTTGKKRRWLGIIYTDTPGEGLQFKDDVNHRYISNYYNAQRKIVESTNSGTYWQYTTATWRESNAGTYQQRGYFVLCRTSQLEFITGSPAHALGVAYAEADQSTGINSASATPSRYNRAITLSGEMVGGGSLSVYAQLFGYNWFTRIEKSDGSNANFFYGSIYGAVSMVEIMG